MTLESRPDTWFLLRGLSREAGHWGRFVPELRAALPAAEVHTIDLPGAGAHHRTDWPESMTAAMEHVRLEAERQAPRAQRGRTFVFAVSLGGMIALEWAARHGHELAGVAVGNTSSGGLSPFWHRARPNSWMRLAAASARTDGVPRERGILAMVSNRVELHDETATAWAEVARQRPMRRGNVLGQLRAAIRWRAPHDAPPVPLLVLVSRADRFVHPSCSRTLARRYGARMVEHPSAGHEITLDAGAWVASQLARFANDLA